MSPRAKPPPREVQGESQPPSNRLVVVPTKHVLLVLLVLRCLNALSLRTFFQPDEYFQALEPAWNIAFGPDSGAWLTWEWHHQLRSSLHPALFAGFYVVADGLARLFHAVPQYRAVVLTAVPQVAQALFAALGDCYTWKLAETVFGDGSAASWAALWMTVLNPWQWYCSTRTFSNSLETTLTIMALYHWPWAVLGSSKEKAEQMVRGGTSAQSLRLSLLLAAIAVILRPTNLLIWLAILTLALTRMTLDGSSPLTSQSLVILGSEIVLCGGLVLAVSAVSDHLYFGFWTFPQYNWLYFNISKNLAVFYGRNDWHYYLSQGIPLLTTTFLPFALLGLYKATTASPEGAAVLRSNTLKTLSFAVTTTVGTLSFISHKEVRFIYPLLPILHVLAAPHAVAFFTSLPLLLPGFPKDAASPTRPPKKSPILMTLFSTLLLANVALAGYLSLFHQPAPLSVLTFLRTEFERLHPTALSSSPAAPFAAPAADAAAAAPELFVLFLTPCHSTPWRSHLVHAALRARALTCEPPLHTGPGSAERESYLDEADRFYARTPAPGGGAPGQRWGADFLHREVWPRGGELPRYIVGFEGIEDMLLRFFDDTEGLGADLGVRLTRVWEGWNGLFNEDWRRRGLLVVWDTETYPNGTKT